MAVQKLYAGAKLRDLRRKLSLTQKEFAARLGVSLPYLNQIENNNRPVSSSILLALAQEFGFDITELSSGESERLVSDLREVLVDPIFSEAQPSLGDLRLVAFNAPAFSRAFLDLHRAYKNTQERMMSFDEALGWQDGHMQPNPWEEVRDFFHYCDNYLDAVDKAAERFAHGWQGPNWLRGNVEKALAGLGIRVELSDQTPLRHYDKTQKRLSLSAHASPPTQIFQLCLQFALITEEPLLEATLDLARFQSPQARDIVKIGLANYFAGAVMMPYRIFLQAAQDERHDLERLARHFGASLEQVAHRLSTLQRPGAKGIPFFFVRVDQAGNITKRHSATRLQFARFGGACPLWNVHRAFETPGRFLRQLAETPDGARYISLAHDVSKTGGAFGAPAHRYAIALGCEVKHAATMVYADGMDLDTPHAYEPIGVSCRVCDRRACHQRALPPLDKELSIDHDLRENLPYSIQ